MSVPISIITPAYVTTQMDFDWLRQCLDYCAPQTDGMVVWDDGSTVSLEPLIQSFPEVTFLGGTHYGKSYSRNHAVQAAPYDLIYPVDADDWIDQDALGVLYGYWDGTPLYSNLIKVHEGDVRQPFDLLDFDCDAAMRHSIASVNILHTKEQWAAVGGWTEGVDLYEDWEYNQKLMWLFCARKIPQRLVYYRQHSRQSTQIATPEQDGQAKAWVAARVRQFINRRSNVPGGCCGSRRSGTSGASGPIRTVQPQAATVQRIAQSVDLSTTVSNLSEIGVPRPGWVKARYVGGRGMGRHNRRGMASRKSYRVKYGDIAEVRKEDSVTRAQFEAGAKNCGFVTIEETAPRPQPAPAPPPPPPPVSEAPVARQPTPIRQVDRQPILDIADVDDVGAMSIRELRNYMKTLGMEELLVLLEQERARNKPRIGAIKMLEKAVQSMT